MRRRALLLAPAIFGMFDGSTSVVGPLMGSTGQPGLMVVRNALLLAVAGGVGMAAGSLISKRSSTGRAEALVIGGATTAGTLLPALPWLALSGGAAAGAAGVLLALLGAAIAVVRARIPPVEGEPTESLGRAAVETYAVLIVVTGAVAATALATGAAG